MERNVGKCRDCGLGAHVGELKREMLAVLIEINRAYCLENKFSNMDVLRKTSCFGNYNIGKSQDTAENPRNHAHKRPIFRKERLARCNSS